MTVAMITAQKLTRVFKDGATEHPVLRGIDLHVPRGQFLAIMGRSGAGKSTLLYQLGLLDHPTGGSITIDGVATEYLSSADRTRFRLVKLGYIFQDYALLPELTAVENIALPLLMQGATRSHAHRASIDALGLVGLANKADAVPSKLSGGEQQRVSIARAIAHRPLVLFADEPTASLDTENADAILKIFRSLREEGQTIVMVTHELEYGRLADRIITMTDGVVVSDEMIH